MPEYDFQQLSPHDLEILARDLLQAEWDVTLENFKTGRDGGIDLRYAQGTNKIIVQVKHYVKTGYRGLLRDLKKEADKVIELQPTRYIIVTSVPLSPQNTQEIADVIGTDFLQLSDIHGQESLNNLLGRHPEVEKNHFKLWLASTAVLDQVINNAAISRSKFKVQQVHKDVRRYVRSAAYPEAQQILSEHQVLIVSGSPGIGKTTLANLILYQHLAQGYQAVTIERDIREGLDLFHAEKRQIFYFDDFLGATFLGDPSATSFGSNDRSLLEFISMIRSTKHSRIVMTTREHIFSQALDKSERLRHANLDEQKVVLSLSSYSRAEKARILYNHLYFSDLPTEYIDVLLRNNFYLLIIKHEKFNPRLVEWLSSFQRIRRVPAEEYETFVQNLLSDPSEIWKHAYEQEITDATRSLMLALFSLGGKANSAELQSVFSCLHQRRSSKYGFRTHPEDFGRAMREANGAFIRPTYANDVEVIDPSVLDLMNSVVREAPDNAIDILIGATSFSQFERVWKLAKADNTDRISLKIRSHAEEVAPKILDLTLAGRQLSVDGATYASYTPTLERRLISVLDLAQKIQTPCINALVSPIFHKLKERWKHATVDIDDTVELFRELGKDESIPPQERISMSDGIYQELANEITSGGLLSDLRECLTIVDQNTRSDALFTAVLSGFEQYHSRSFTTELHSCQSLEEYDGLYEDLEFVGEQLGKSVEAFQDAVATERLEFQENLDQYEDHMYEEWKDQRRGEREDSKSISDMFGSLKNEG